MGEAMDSKEEIAEPKSSEVVAMVAAPAREVVETIVPRKPKPRGQWIFYAPDGGICVRKRPRAS